jgi:threonine dehydratase
VDLAEVFRARRRIAPYARRTPLVESPWLSEAARASVWLKLESLQVSNSFKSRGAFNAVLARLRHPPIRLVTASAGNHGRALAMAAEIFGLPLTVFTPAGAPEAKLAAIRRHRAELRTDAPDYDEAERRAKAFARETGADFISPYNDADVIAGAATIALEIIEDRPETNALVVPIGGGGLASGVGLAAKAIDPRLDVTGVELAVSCPFQTSIRAGRLVTIVPGPTLADGLVGNPDPETITFDLVRRFVNRIVTVSEDGLATAVVGLLEREHLVAEGAGAAAAAALLQGRIDLAGRRIVVIISGANIDLSRLASLLRSANPAALDREPH